MMLTELVSAHDLHAATVEPVPRGWKSSGLQAFPSRPVAHGSLKAGIWDPQCTVALRDPRSMPTGRTCVQSALLFELVSRHGIPVQHCHVSCSCSFPSRVWSEQKLKPGFVAANDGKSTSVSHQDIILPGCAAALPVS